MYPRIQENVLVCSPPEIEIIKFLAAPMALLRSTGNSICKYSARHRRLIIMADLEKIIGYKNFT